MEKQVLKSIMELAAQPEAVERSTEYMAQMLGQFLKKNERVLILVERQDGDICRILDQAIRKCQANPVWLGEDRRWITILKTAFTSKCNCMIGYPLMLLGLSKVARQMGTPLFARNVVMYGYATSDWIAKTVEKGLDCKIWGCYDPAAVGLISGFSCKSRMGVHIREEEYGVEAVDASGNRVPAGEMGDLVVYPKSNPELRFRTRERGRMERSVCSCGRPGARLLDFDADMSRYGELAVIGEKLHYWSSILDCRVRKTEMGLYLEVIVFPGEKLPELPSVAQLVLHPWNPETDIPFPHHHILKKQYQL